MHYCNRNRKGILHRHSVIRIELVYSPQLYSRVRAYTCVRPYPCMCACMRVRACMYTCQYDDAPGHVIYCVPPLGFTPRRCLYITVLISRDRSSGPWQQNDMSLPKGMFYSSDIKIVISQPISVSRFPVSVYRSH